MDNEKDKNKEEDNEYLTNDLYLLYIAEGGEPL